MKRTTTATAAALRATTQSPGATATRLAAAAPVLVSRKGELHEINVPSWGHYKRHAEEGGETGGRAFSYMILGTAGVGYAAAAKHSVSKLLDSMNPAANARAMANVEVDLSAIAEGTTMTVKWRGKPLFVRHRTAAEIAREESTPLDGMRDPAPDAARRKPDKPQWLIVLGICTHLGCVPLGGQGDYGGWFCPCHGSHYDAAGRIRKGPAPLNLEVPPYVFQDEDKVLVGVDTL